MDGMGAVDGEEKPGDHHAGMMAGQLNQGIGKIHQKSRHYPLWN